MATVDTATTPVDERGSAVRFETQCVVIPDHAHHSRRPRVVTKSYALPLWKRRTASAGSASPPLQGDVPLEESSSHLVLRVPLPTLSRKHTPTTRAVDPLPPCLVHRPQPSEGPSSPSLHRQRTPRKASPSPSRSDLVTVPLRPCCAACQSVTEAALVEGDTWAEHFSRVASRRRSLSVDGSPRTLTVAGSAASASYGALGVAISVDEIDKRRRASDSHEALWSKSDEYGMPLFHGRSAPFCVSADTRPPPSPSTPRIPEEDDDEDENELFPLPSPKRTPSTSPAPSLTGSMSSLTVAQPNHSSGTSPTPSTCSGDSPLPPPRRQFLAPPTSSSSSLSLPKFSGSTTDLAMSLADDPPPSPSVLSALPSLSGRHRPRSPSPRLSFIPPTPTDALPPATDSDTMPPATEPAPAPSSPRQSPSQTRLPWRGKRSASMDIVGPELSPTLSTTSKKSFTMSNPLQLFADAIRGVGSLGSSSIVPGV